MRRIFVLGDSISIHYGPYLKSFLAGAFYYDRKRGASGDLDMAEGANGGDSRNVRAFLRDQMTTGALAADVLLLNCGLHDIKVHPGAQKCQIPLVEYRSNLLSILDLAAKHRLQIVWIRTTPVVDGIHNSRSSTFSRYAADVDRYNQEADRLMAGHNVPSIDLHGLTANFVPDGFVDHVHYTDEVRRLQAAFIAGSLLQLLRNVAPLPAGSNEKHH